jgi:hypothetical protein
MAQRRVIQSRVFEILNENPTLADNVGEVGKMYIQTFGRKANYIDLRKAVNAWSMQRVDEQQIATDMAMGGPVSEELPETSAPTDEGVKGILVSDRLLAVMPTVNAAVHGIDHDRVTDICDAIDEAGGTEEFKRCLALIQAIIIPRDTKKNLDAGTIRNLAQG